MISGLNEKKIFEVLQQTKDPLSRKQNRLSHIQNQAIKKLLMEMSKVFLIISFYWPIVISAAVTLFVHATPSIQIPVHAMKFARAMMFAPVMLNALAIVIHVLVFLTGDAAP